MTPARRETIKAIIGEIEDAKAKLEGLRNKILAVQEDEALELRERVDAEDADWTMLDQIQAARLGVWNAQLEARDAAVYLASLSGGA